MGIEEGEVVKNWKVFNVQRTSAVFRLNFELCVAKGELLRNLQSATLFEVLHCGKILMFQLADQLRKRAVKCGIWVQTLNFL